MQLTATITEDFSSIVQVPAPQTSLDSIIEFSHAYDAYDAYGIHGNLERIAMIADAVWSARDAGELDDCELDDLRTALFMTQRGWYHHGAATVESPIGVEWELVNAIHQASGGLVRNDRPILL